jgi:hypothetical protein
MTFVGLLEADLQGAVEYKTGGIGPLFQEARTEEPLALDEFLSRTMAALRKVGLRNAVSLFVDEQEVFSDPDAGGQDNLDAVLRNAKDADVGEGTSFYLMLTHEDKDLSHLITVEGTVDHPADEAAMSVLDMARFLDGREPEAKEDAGLDEEEDGDDKSRADDGLPDITFDERDGEAMVEAFLQKLLGELQKELALDDPDIDTWTDWDGEYDPDLRYSSALPGTGLG